MFRTVTLDAAAFDHFQIPYEPSQTLGVAVLRQRPWATLASEQ